MSNPITPNPSASSSSSAARKKAPDRNYEEQQRMEDLARTIESQASLIRHSFNRSETLPTTKRHFQNHLHALHHPPLYPLAALPTSGSPEPGLKFGPGAPVVPHLRASSAAAGAAGAGPSRSKGESSKSTPGSAKRRDKKMSEPESSPERTRKRSVRPAAVNSSARRRRRSASLVEQSP